ncbi:hypothetical protein CRG98_012110 [Punica granatum]|uniref:Uncharacterized protein n=1 Tax=Punica granatum TaxID=22663 RepID=A0A2I0KI80_PUNGR|nr:hypothetical protein CRG98_012110 [Punica granatum]
MAPNRPGWNTGQTRLAQVGSDVATEAPDGILRQDILKWKTNASCLEGRSQGTWTAMGMGEAEMSWPWVPRVVRHEDRDGSSWAKETRLRRSRAPLGPGGPMTVLVTRIHA